MDLEKKQLNFMIWIRIHEPEPRAVAVVLSEEGNQVPAIFGPDTFRRY